MSDIKRKVVIGLLIAALILLIINFVLLTKTREKELEIDTIQEIVIEPFRVRSKATAEVYTAVSALVNEDDIIELEIYNYYTDKYEWYPIYKFYKYSVIAAYINEEYVENDITDFIDFAKYDESEL